MDKKKLIFGVATFAAGAVVGFIVGSKLLKRKVEGEAREKLDREVRQLQAEKKTTNPDPADISDEEEKKRYEQMISDLRYKTDAPDSYNADEEIGSDPDDIHTDDADVTKEGPKKHKKPKVLGADEYDPDDPDTDYPVEDLYYFMQSELLTNDQGQLKNETDTVGNKLRQLGYMQGQGNLDDIWVRNYDDEIDYFVHRRACAVEDQFGEEENE